MEFEGRCEWPRFKSYTIANGRIVPNLDDAFRPQGHEPIRFYSNGSVVSGHRHATDAAALLMDPESAYRPLYLTLADLAPLQGVAFEAGAVAWCNQHGPLGILPHMLMQATTPTGTDLSLGVTRRQGRFAKLFSLGAGPVEPHATLLKWTGGGAVLRRVALTGNAADAFSPFLGAGWMRRLVKQTGEPALFGDEQKTVPWFDGSEDFWAGYGEPLERVHDFCWIVRQATWVLASPADEAAPVVPGVSRPVRSSGFAALDYLLSATSLSAAPRTSPTSGALQGAELYLASVSMLGLLGYLLAADAATGVLHVCENRTCRRVFVGDKRARYCSQRCRGTQKMRRHRSKEPS